jgi:hypothetical protein
MLPDNFNFALVPVGVNLQLSEIGMLASDIENIDSSIMSWVKNDLDLSAFTNEGFTKVPVLWQAPERAYQVKHNKSLRDDAGALKLPLLSVERTGVIKDPARKGGFQAQIYSNRGDGRTGRMVLARKIVEDKTRNFAVAGGTRTNTSGSLQQWFPRVNKRIVVKTLSIPIPIYINVEYKIVIKTEYQQQMNDLIAPFMTRTGQINAFIMRQNGHMYEGFIDQGFTHSNNIANLGEDTRLFTSEITIRVLGYLIGEGTNDDRNIVRVDENVVEYMFPQEGLVVEGEEGFYKFTS